MFTEIEVHNLLRSLRGSKMYKRMLLRPILADDYWSVHEKCFILHFIVARPPTFYIATRDIDTWVSVLLSDRP